MKLRTLVLLVLFISTLVAQNHSYILSHDGLVDQRAQIKINQIGTEIKEKIGTSIFLHIIKDNNIDMKLSREERIIQMREYDKQVLSRLTKKELTNYIILTLATDQIYANILMSNNLKDVIDKNDILNGYVIPLLASMDKNALSAKTSAACFNGYAQIADVLAENKGIELVSSIGSEGKTAATIWKIFMYSMVFVGIVSYILIILRERKMKK